MGARTGKPRGRPVGAKNQKTVLREAKMQEAAQMISEAIDGAFEGDSHALLMTVYKDPRQPWNIRVDAAKAALAYEKPRLAAIELSGTFGLNHEDALSELE
jgi:hypothetical protein